MVSGLLHRQHAVGALKKAGKVPCLFDVLPDGRYIGCLGLSWASIYAEHTAWLSSA